MPKAGGSSSRAAIHPYLKPDFIWPEIDYSGKDILCDVNDEVFTQDRLKEFRANRLFYFNEGLCKLFGLNYYQRGQVVTLNKSLIQNNPKIQNEWDQNHLKRWMSLQQEEIRLVNNGTSWWLAETTWIKTEL